MVLEHALLSVRPGQEAAFEDAFARATAIIAGMRGFGRLTLSRGLERPGTYLLLVEWASLEDHTVGFRGSAGYQAWRELLHHFYDPFPLVEHYEQVLRTATTVGGQTVYVPPSAGRALAAADPPAASSAGDAPAGAVTDARAGQ